MTLADQDIERRYLGGCLLHQAHLVAHPVPSEAFTLPALRLIHGAMMAIHRRGQDVTTLGVKLELEATGTLGAVGYESILDLSNSLDLDSRASADRLRSLYAARRIVLACREGVTLAETGKLSEARLRLSAAAFDSDTESPVYSLLECVEAAAEAWQHAAEARTDRSKGSYLPLGLAPAIDSKVLIGPGDAVVIGAETNVGKSSISMTCLLSHYERGVPAGLVSVEDPREDWGAKAAGHWSDVDTTQFWSGQASREAWAAVMAGIGGHMKREQVVKMADVKTGRLDDVLQSMATLVRVHGSRILFVDYLQAIQPPDSLAKAHPKQQIDHVYSAIKTTARLLGVPVVITSQLSRGESEHGAEPGIKRLKESGNLENGAQIVLLAWCDDPNNAIVKVKAAKLKRVLQRPRFAMARGHGGVLRELDYWPEEQKQNGGHKW